MEEDTQTGRTGISSEGGTRGLPGLWKTGSKCSQPLLFSRDCSIPLGPCPLVMSLHTYVLPDLPFFPLFFLKVKIWFQNKRSKYKKLLKQNSGGQEGDFTGRPPSLSPCSPPLPSLWDLPKAGALATGGYGNSFGAWYQHHPPDILAPPQMM